MARRMAPSGRVSTTRWILAASALLAVAGMIGGASGMPMGRGSLSSAAPNHTKALSWQQLPTTVAPSIRNWFGMAYDPVAKYTVLYGGYNPNAGVAYSDTWIFSAGNWTNLNLAVHPSGLSGLKLVYDPRLGGVVAFGGEALYGSSYYNDTWLFKAGNWTQLFPTVSPSPRSQFAMAWDNTDSEIVLFGGYHGGAAYSDTWTFNGTTWTPVVTAVHPEGRVFANMAFDARSGKTLLDGGNNYTLGPVNKTWAFSRGTWKSLPHSNMPGRTHTPIATLANGTPFFFGGQASYPSSVPLYNTSYEFFGGQWHQVHVSNAPSPRSNGGLVYDASVGHLLMFGGGIVGAMWNQTYVLK
jgi:Kelch motif protein